MKCADKVIRGGLVCDGTGAPLRQADVLIKDDKIQDVLPPGTELSDDIEVISANGAVVAPGFIDAHSHFDVIKLDYPKNLTKLLQGVTTEVVGNCGIASTCVPYKSEKYQWNSLGEYGDVLDKSGQATNTVALCGHNNVRRYVMGTENRRPTVDELAKMKSLVSQALSEGAAGLSTGLTYFPGKFADTAELIELAKMLNGKVYATHVRSEGDALLEAAAEAVEIAEKAQCQLQFSHMKTMFTRNHYKCPALIELLENARKRGTTIYADRYPYLHSATIFRQILPSPYDVIPDIASFLQESQENFDNVVASLKHSPRDLPTTILLEPPYRGMTLKDAAEKAGKSMELLATELLRDVPGCDAAYLAMCQENLEKILALPWVCPGSDSGAQILDAPNQFGHPRAAGTFPTFFQYVCKMQGVPEAVRRMTSLPASIFKIPKRGIIQKGYIADIVVFEPEKYISHADFTGENMMPEGVRQVFVAGKTASSNGRFIPIY